MVRVTGVLALPDGIASSIDLSSMNPFKFFSRGRSVPESRAWQFVGVFLEHVHGEVETLRGMPPTLYSRPALFTNRSISRYLEHAGDRQMFDFTVSGAPGSTYQCRRHAAEALNGEAAKRPSN